LIRGWIDECVETHSNCPSDTQSELPTRVIDVGSDVSPPKLHIANGQVAKYIALSHCWGDALKSSQTIKTTHNTFAQWQTEIPWALLSKTFQDAITITRRLGLRYLWIDSLCIIQGDADDWISESVKMASVYAKALVVIAATGAKDGDAGCFIGSKQQPRSANEYGALRLGGKSDNGQEAYAYARRSRYTPSITLASLRGGEMVHGWKSALGQPLEKRAWTLQEEAFGIRVLYYTEDEVRWRCSEYVACECLGKRKAPGSAGWRKELIQSATLNSTQRNGSDQEYTGGSMMRSVWQALVSEYTRRHLTYQTDRLVGLSGLAGAWECSEDDIYLAGLWKRQLPRYLVWYAHGPSPLASKRESRRHESYYAPSWSWASITGPVDFFRSQRQLEQYQLTVLEAKTEPTTINRFGPVQNGHLRLLTFLVPVQLRQKATTSNDSTVLFELITDQSMDMETIGDVLLDIYLPTGYVEIKGGEQYFLLPVSCDHKYQRIEVVSIILRDSQSSKAAYERVGIVKTEIKGTWDEFKASYKEEAITVV